MSTSTTCGCGKPTCYYDGCTGATVQQMWSPFCSQICAALWAMQATDSHAWCTTCAEWHDFECTLKVPAVAATR